MPKNRAKVVNPEAAERFYSPVSNKVAELEARDGKRMLPTHFWNTDESGFCRNQGKNRVLCRKGKMINCLKRKS